MTSRERVRAAMLHEMPDRVPVMCQLALGHYFLNSDRRPSDIWFDSAVFAATLAEFQRRYRFDGFLINLPGRPPDWREYLGSYENLKEGERLTWRAGLETFFPPDDNPHTFLPGRRPLPRATLAAVDPSDPDTYLAPGYLWNTTHSPTLWDVPAGADMTAPAAYPAWFTRGLRAARAACPDVSVHVEVFSPFTGLLELFGYEPGLMALLDAPDVCHALLDVLTRRAIAEVECYAPCGPDAVLISSAFAGAGFIGRDAYREFVAPCEQRVIDAIHTHGLPAYMHTCGAIGDRLDLMADSGADGIDTLDPPPLGTVDLAKAKTEYGRRFFFKGNLDAVNEMLSGDDATFEQAVRRRIEIGMPGSGYILSSACSVAPRVNPQRLARMVEWADRYGRY